MAQNKYRKRKKGEKSAIQKLMSYFSVEKGKIIIAIIFSIIGALAMLAAPLMLQEMNKIILGASSANRAFTDVDKQGIVLWACLGGSLSLLAFIGQGITSFIVAAVCARNNERLRNDMVVKINRLPLNYFDTRNIGDVLSYVANDVDIIGSTLNQTLSTAISSAVTLVGVIIIMFTLSSDSWIIGIISLLIIPVILLALVKVGGVSQKHFLVRQNLTGSVSSYAEESFTGFNIIRTFNASEDFCDRFGEINANLEKAMDKGDYYAGLATPLMVFLGNVFFSIVALFGGLIACRYLGDPGYTDKVVMVVTAVTFADHLIQPITNLATVFGTMQQTVASATRVFNFLEEQNEPDESYKTEVIPKIEGNIQFEHVKFGYTKDRVIVHDFSEKGTSGQKIAIVGPTGAGKTTMVNLLMRFYEVNSGKITIEGIDTKTLNRSYVRSLFGMVLQDTWLFEGTIMENLKYSRPDATDEEVYAACEATHCDTFIRQQPGGYDHILNEDCGLSSGQKQLLTIARAMIQNAPMLILDEATSSVDTRTELQIQDAMDKLMEGRTSFVIAHRLSTIKNSDLIIVMKDGDVIETGNHDELMKQDGFYAALYNSQFTGKGPQLA
ncbi:MAG: ABC transporter ATP-binding protein/permease [Bacilli bacterium]|nr:ABC transporter ATP-binding protein/permease [Bacilli bacterium]